MTNQTKNERSGDEWAAFRAADYAGKITILKEKIESGQYLYPEMIADLLPPLRQQALAAGSESHFHELIHSLEECRPAIFQQMAPQLLEWRIIDALRQGHEEELAGLIPQIAATAADQPINFSYNLDRLAYYNQPDLIIETLRQAWPAMKEAAGEIAGSLDGLAARAADTIIYRYLETNPQPNAHDPALQEQLRFYFDIHPQRLDQHIAILRGDIAIKWRIEHFKLPARGESVPQAVALNLQTLALDFVGYLQRQERVAYVKADLARRQLPRYILDRQAGVLDPRQAADILRQGGAAGLPIQPAPARHPLCPDRQTFQRFLEQLTTPAHPQPYRAAAALELSPGWLRFLEARGLINAGLRQEISAELRQIEPVPL